jgi:oxygen-independent coproporphyrinogen-3 oxidase
MTEHLYVHIPFCRSRCSYCDFASEPVGPHARAGRLDQYVEALRAELEQRAPAPHRPGRSRVSASSSTGGGRAVFETIYLGGGTPTVLGAELLLPLVERLGSMLVEGGEFTIEANPGTVDATLFTLLSQVGVTRLSLGIQSFSRAGLSALGRGVEQREVEAALEAVASVGWQEWNLDLVFGIPGQSWAEMKADLDAALDARPSHISLYDLTYSPAYDAWVTANLGAGARGAAGALAEERYGEAVAHLEAAGYRRYEVSNFALPGHECRHNLAYWRGEDYLGLGASAVSTQGAERRTNPEKVADYLAGRPPSLELLTPETRMWEKAMLGLRTSEGVDEDSVADVLDPGLARLLEQGCLERRYGRLRLNAGFLDVSNSVIAALLVSPGGS